MPSSRNFLAALWRLIPRFLHWRLVWLFHAKFNVGVAGVLFTPDNQVLLLRHVFRRKYRWGLPSGWARSGETAAQTLARELREETGLACTVDAPLRFETGYRLRVEIVLTGSVRLADATLNHEILECRAFDPGDLPIDLLPEHAGYICQAVALRTAEPLLPAPQ
jgi:8-oxo-dGTP diphosphatase